MKTFTPEIVMAYLYKFSITAGNPRARGLSFLQLGLRELARLCYERLPLPILQALPKGNPPPACASQCKRDAVDCRIEFARVLTFSW